MQYLHRFLAIYLITSDGKFNEILYLCLTLRNIQQEQMTEFHTLTEMQHIIAERGFLPFFDNEIPRFSISEYTPSELWFSDEQDGPWEWKGPAIIEGDFAYGKFFQSKAGFITMDWFPDFVNYRRSRFSLSRQELIILDTIKAHHSLLSKEIKKLCGYVKPRMPRTGNPLEKMMTEETRKLVKPKKADKEGYETAITKLQMSAQVVTADFEYQYDKQGKHYGWGVARYCTPEDFFGSERIAIDRTPEDSYLRMFHHLRDVLPWAKEEWITHLLG